ncbi:MAG: hypothetical protein GWN87_32180, partial [Desulfuromonadales bacterium]|nr:hypothetical protein [Desulfuromonadales bacterium]NIS42880.1 hypothetical protein [Desulfuromonadales bacterium]
MSSCWPQRQEWTRILLEAVVLFVLGVLLGLTVNYRLAMDILSGEISAPKRPVLAQQDSDEA